MRITSGQARKSLRRAALVGGLAIGVAACTPMIRNHGYVPTEEMLAEVIVGVDTRDSVAETLGAPAATGVLGESSYYYVASTFSQMGPFAPKEIDRTLLAVTFDSRGVVSNIIRYGLEDGQVVILSRRVTDDNVRDTTLIRQLMGNLGRFTAESFVGP